MKKSDLLKAARDYIALPETSNSFPMCFAIDHMCHNVSRVIPDEERDELIDMARELKAKILNDIAPFSMYPAYLRSRDPQFRDLYNIAATANDIYDEVRRRRIAYLDHWIAQLQEKGE